MGNFNVEIVEKGTICRLSGNLMSSEDAEQFQNIVDEAANSENRNLIIDFSDVSLLGSLVLGHLVRAQAHLAKADGRIAFCGFSESIINVLKMTRVHTIINVYKDIDDARRILK